MDQKLVMPPPQSPRSSLTGAFLFLVLLALPPARAGIGENPDLETIFQFTLAPSGLTSAPDGTWVLGVNQDEKPRLRAVRISRSGDVSPFPNEKMSQGDPTSPTPLDAVEALQTDPAGVVWMLDNGRRSELPPKVVGWNHEKQRVQQVIHLSPPAVVPGSFVADLLVDAFSPLIVISDPANGTNAALILLDRSTGIARRCLQGHPSLQPDPLVELRVTRTGQETRRLDGSAMMPHCGVRPLAMDRKGQWLYFAAVQSRVIYRLPTALLRAADTSEEALAKAVEKYADKPAAASFTLDNKNNLYLGDLESRSISVIDPEHKTCRPITSDPRLVWPDGLCFGQDGKLYFFSRTQATVAAPRDGRALGTEHSMFRMQPLAPGQPGN